MIEIYNTNVSKPNDGREMSTLEEIVLGKYVLIIGDDVILRQDIHDGKIENLIDCLIDKEEKNRRFGRRENYDKKCSYVLTKCYDFPLSDINPDIKDLLSTKCFPVVITTSVTPYLEKLMREIWGEELAVRSIYSVNRDIDVEDGYEFGVRPTLYYAFGSCKMGRFVKNEYDMMSALSRWINIEYSPTKFKKYVWDQKLKSIGCTFEDWYFRFLWFTMTGSFEKESRLSDGTITLEEHQERSLIDYLEITAGVETEYNARMSLERLTSLICVRDKDNNLFNNSNRTFQNLRYEEIIGNRSLGGVFISYAHEDFEFAEKLFYTLKEKGFNVWFDNENLPYVDNVGYPKRVSNALRQTSIFMPILSNQTIYDMENDNKRCYIEDEWKHIPSDVKIAAICIQDYKAGVNNYHKKVQQIIPSFSNNVAQVFYVKKNEKSFLKFIDDLKHALE